MPRWTATISHTQQQTAAVVPFCTAITMGRYKNAERGMEWNGGMEYGMQRQTVKKT